MISKYKITSPTSITIAGNMNKLVSAIVGTVLFKNKVTANIIAGLLVCLAGGLLYSWKVNILADLEACISFWSKSSEQMAAEVEESRSPRKKTGGAGGIGNSSSEDIQQLLPNGDASPSPA